VSVGKAIIKISANYAFRIKTFPNQGDKGMMRIIETVLPACNSAESQDDKFDSSALIHNILLMVPDYALIPSRLPLRFDLVACGTISVDRTSRRNT